MRWRKDGSAYGDPGAGVSGTDVATTTTHARTDMCTQPAREAGWISPGRIYRGDLTNLLNMQRYFYQVGSQAGGWSAERSFVTPPAANDATATMRVLITADSGMYTPDHARVPNGNFFAVQYLAQGAVSTVGHPRCTAAQAVLQSTGLGPGQQPGSKGVVDAMKAAMERGDTHLIVNNGDLA